jgi:hypothetical protein
MPIPTFDHANAAMAPKRHPTESTPMRCGGGQWLLAEIPVYQSAPTAYRPPAPYVVSLRKGERAEVRELGLKRFPRVARWWDYNEVAGWIQLFVVPGGMVKGYLWRKRIAKKPNKGRVLFDLEGRGSHDLECLFVQYESSAEIYDRVRGELVALIEQEFPAGYYLDLESFDTIGPALNWRALIELR